MIFAGYPVQAAPAAKCAETHAPQKIQCQIQGFQRSLDLAPSHDHPQNHCGFLQLLETSSVSQVCENTGKPAPAGNLPCKYAKSQGGKNAQWFCTVCTRLHGALDGSPGLLHTGFISKQHRAAVSGKLVQRRQARRPQAGSQAEAGTKRKRAERKKSAPTA